jgi:hypothetical protein
MAGEKAFYETDQTDPARSTFGVIAVTSNLDGTGHVLLMKESTWPEPRPQQTIFSAMLQERF